MRWHQSGEIAWNSRGSLINCKAAKPVLALHFKGHLTICVAALHVRQPQQLGGCFTAVRSLHQLLNPLWGYLTVVRLIQQFWGCCQAASSVVRLFQSCEVSSSVVRLPHPLRGFSKLLGYLIGCKATSLIVRPPHQLWGYLKLQYCLTFFVIQ